VSVSANVIHDDREKKVHLQARRKDSAKIERFRHYADDSECPLVERNRLPDNLRIPRKLALPEGLGQQDCGPSTLHALLASEQPPQRRLYAERLKEIPGYPNPEDRLRFTEAR
jgi:hypothetical protein